MTYDSRGHAVESADISDQRHENTMLNSRNNESNQPSEQLIENFPETKLRSLIAKISSPRWVVPVLPDQELECLLNYAIELTKAGIDEECESCMRFYREGLTVSFMKILTDEAVNSWKYNIHYCIFNSCVKFMQLCALHLKRDNTYLLELLSVVLDPDNKFNTFNISRQATNSSFVSLAASVKNENSIGQQSPAISTTPTSTTVNTTSTTTTATTTPSTPSVSQTQNVDENTFPIVETAETNSTSPSAMNKPSTSPVNTTLNSTSVTQLRQSPVQCNENASTQSRNQSQNNTTNAWGILSEDQLYAKSPPEPHHPRGWLVDLINRFGQYGGFDNLLDRFYGGVASVQKKSNEQPIDAKEATTKTVTSNGVATVRPTTTTPINTTTKTNESNSNITLHLIYALVRPFGQCYELLTVRTIEKYFLPMWSIVLELLNNLSDDELKREAKPEGRNDLINGIIKAARCLTSRLSNQENLIKELEMFRLKMILRLLKISSFNGKMSALNEINKILFAFSYYPRQSQIPMCAPEEEIDWLNAEKIAKWIKDSNVLGIVLHDSLHQPQYVDKLEKILRFLIKEKALTLSDLDAVWQAQAGKHEAIVKNVHDLLAKLAYDFNTEQLDHLFGCFQASMKSANKHQRERLLELIRRLAEDDKSGVMAHKVLKLFWTLAHSLEISKEVMEQALTAHVKILDYSCAQERDAQKTIWLSKCVEELKQDNGWVLPALRLIREICCLYDPSTSHVQRMHQSFNRQHVIERLQNEHTLVILVTNSLITYMDRVRTIIKEKPDTVPETLLLDQRYPHQQQIQERLDFLKFVLKDGQLWLCSDQAKQIWQCLAVHAAFATDREECFRWFGKLMGEEPDLDPGINKDFFENNILQLDPQLLTESGIRCFERFFKAVNSKEEKLKAKSRSYILDDEDLIGKDYLWRVITTGNEIISHKAIQLLKEVSTALGPRLQANIATFHENFIKECCDRLRAYYDNIMVLTDTMQAENVQENSDENKDNKMRHVEAEKMCRVIIMLLEYIVECDRAYTGERICLPMSRAYRGKHVTLYVRIQFPGRQQTEDIEVNTHSNEMVSSFKRQLLKRIKSTPNNIKIDFFYPNDNLIEINDDQNAISYYNIRDKMLITAKLSPYSPGLSSSPDSSSDSSTGSPPRPCPDMMKPENERQLPGIIIAQKPQYTEFFLRLYQLGIDLNHALLREGCRSLLHLLPIDRLTSQKLQQMCNPLATYDNLVTVTPEMMFLHPPFAQVIYNLEVMYALLIPAIEQNQSFQLSWIHSGVAHFILELLTKNNFIPNSDVHTKRAAFTNVLRLSKIFLFVVGCILSKVGDEPASSAGETGRSQIDLLKSTFTNILGQTEQTIRLIAMKLADSLSNEMLSYEPEGEICRKLFASALKWSCPDVQTIKAIVQLAWASGCGHLNMLDSSNSFSDSKPTPEQADHNLCKEALEVLTISLVLNPDASESLSKDPMWPKFILALVLENPMRQIRQSATEQLYLICTYCATDWRPFSFVIALLIDALENLAPHNSSTCAEFFQLLCRTLNYGCLYNWPFPINDVLLTQEISWLRAILENVKRFGETSVHEDLLEGHLCLTKELMFYFNADLKSQLTDFIMEILDEFLFPASRQYLQLYQSDQLINFDAAPPVCRSPHTITAACDLLIALCQNSIPNMKLIVNNSVNMICTHSEPLREWEYLPPINARPFKGFCGLKNAGATCYMNSVLQQLFMVPSIRVGILGATGACNDPHEDFSNEAESPPDYYRIENDTELHNLSVRERYNVSILKHVQAIFAHLGHSALQFYVPRGLWSQFKLQGEPVNLREQQDAVEFFMSILDSLDEGLKALGHPQLMASTLGGCFSDQKICKECPHRYSKEEPFSVFSVDIRNHSSLTESLEQYVKGELLEGADAYHCDKCNKKVVTIKRLCVRKLPPVLAIQLKRFEYDYERDCAIKFNDYFEFPRELDMEPYTVSGLAKIEGEVIEYEDELDDSQSPTKYQLTGIVVHSGQASGGHYFSYILHKDYETGKDQWYKFDDGEVTECKMHEDEELKAQCFGGDYMGEVFDSNLKRMQFRRQKRWWNAYMLFYTRCDQKFMHEKSLKEQLSLAESRHCILPMPEPIERSVRIQNIRFLHSRDIFTSEYFNFIRKMVHSSAPTRVEKMTPQLEELSLLGIQLASRFLFHTGFHTKKTLRGASNDWYETLSLHLRQSTMVRRWFCENALLSVPGRLAEYVLVAPTPELRSMFVKLIVFLCHFAMGDEPLQSIQPTADSLCEQILMHVLYLLRTDVPDNGKHLTQYFTLFNMYAGMSTQQRQQLLKLNVPAIFMQVALDEGPGLPIKHQYPELCKLHHVVSMLVRCSDITSECSSPNESPILPNVYGDPQINPEERIKLSKEAMQHLFQKTSYVKKIIEDVHVGDEGLKLLQYCCWENPIFSRNVLVELLWQCGFTYWHDLRHHTDMLLNILLMEDSWQNHRIHNALLGVAEEREGLLEIIQRTKTHYQKRAYQIMKCLVQLFKTCQCAHDMLLSNFKVTTQWVMACEWLREELDRRVPSNQYSYSSWSHSSVAISSVATNDNSNGYMLERSQSAKNLMALAFELCPSELDATETEEISDGVLVRLQSQQMLDQIHADGPLETSGTGPVDGDNESSESEEDPCESRKKIHVKHITMKNNQLIKGRQVRDLNESETVQNDDDKKMQMDFPHADDCENRRSPYEDDEQEDDNDTNITDDEENVDVNNYYQKLGIIDDKNDGTNSSRLKSLLETQEVTNEMKNLLITNPNATETDIEKPDVKPNVPATSSSPPTVQSKTEQ